MHSALFVRDVLIFPHVIRKVLRLRARKSCMYDLLMESEERRERLRRKNQRDRDRRAAESAQQREVRLTRQRVRNRARRASWSAAQRESFGSQEPDGD